jgi:hypothetical protein
VHSHCFHIADNVYDFNQQPDFPISGFAPITGATMTAFLSEEIPVAPFCLDFYRISTKKQALYWLFTAVINTRLDLISFRI